MNNYGYFNQQPIMPTNSYAFVNGIEGAKSYPVPPNKTILLMDSDNPIFYFKSSNDLGQCSIKTYEFKEITTQQDNNQKYVLKSDFDELKNKVEEMLNAKSIEQ